MICPQCRTDNLQEVTLCESCGAPLVAQPEREEPNLELVDILETSDATLIPVVKSLLETEGIEVLVQGEGVQDLVGLGRISGMNIAAGPARFLVREDQAERARQIIAHLNPGAVELPPEQDVETSS